MFHVRSRGLRARAAKVPRRSPHGAIAVLLLFAGCRESAGPDALAPSRAAVSPTAPAGTQAAHAEPTATDPLTALPSAEPSATPPAPTVEAPALLAEDGTPLPQTDEPPRSDTPAFRQRIERLVEAIAKDEPELAHSAFFPVVAYAQVKAIAKPERDWEQRLVRAFDRTIHEYHRALGADAASARLVAVEVPDTARYMKPGSEGNRVGYYRVLRSRLLLETADEKSHSLEITSLISWRGEWYVVHLKGFQ